MKASLLTKLEALADRHQEVEALLGNAEVINDQNRFRELSVEFAHLNDVVAQYQRWQQLQAELEGARQLLEDSDADIKALATEEVAAASVALEEIESALQVLLLPRDPNDGSNVFLEIRAGTGGDEAAIFSGDLFRMYHRYAEQKGWSVEILSERSGEHGGYKELISRVAGQDVYSHLNLNPVLTGCSAFPKPNLRAGFIPLPAQWRCCLSWKRSTVSISGKRISASIPSGPPGPVVNTSTPQIRRCV